jgi:hypothetical protein
MKAAAPIIHRNPKLAQLRRLVTAVRSRLAKLEAEFTREKSRLDAVQAALCQRLRERNQKRDRLRLAVHFRQKFLDSFVRDNTDEVEQAESDLRQAKAQLDKDYEALAAAAEKKKPLTAKEETGLTLLWTKLVKLYRRDRFARSPDQLEAYHRLIAAIHQARDSGDIERLREIAEDPPGFMLRHGWAKLDFGDVEELAQLRRLHETLQTEIAVVTESLKELRKSPDYKQRQLAKQKGSGLDKLTAKRAKRLEVENAKLELQAERLAKEIKRISGRPAE